MRVSVFFIYSTQKHLKILHKIYIAWTRLFFNIVNMPYLRQCLVNHMAPILANNGRNDLKLFTWQIELLSACRSNALDISELFYVIFPGNAGEEWSVGAFNNVTFFEYLRVTTSAGEIWRRSFGGVLLHCSFSSAICFSVCVLFLN